VVNHITVTALLLLSSLGCW